MTLPDKFAALVAARAARVAAQTTETTCTHSLFNQSDPNDEVIKPGQGAADLTEKLFYANDAGVGKTYEVVGYVGPTAPPAA